MRFDHFFFCYLLARWSGGNNKIQYVYLSGDGEPRSKFMSKYKRNISIARIVVWQTFTPAIISVREQHFGELAREQHISMFCWAFPGCWAEGAFRELVAFYSAGVVYLIWTEIIACSRRASQSIQISWMKLSHWSDIVLAWWIYMDCVYDLS